MAGTDGEDENEDGGLKGLLQNGIVIVIRYERQQESKVPWHMRFTPSWQFTLEDRLRADHQRRRQQQALRLMTVRTDGPGSDVYMGKRLELTTEKLRAYPVCTSWSTGTNVKREPDDGRNVFKVNALVAGLRTPNVRNISGERRCGKGLHGGRLQEIDQKPGGGTRRERQEKLATGMVLPDGWAIIPANWQGAACVVRTGHFDGPPAFQASFESLGPIVNNLQEVVTKLLATVRDAFALNWQQCGPQFCNRRTLGAIFATKRRLLRTRIIISGVFCNSFYADGDESEQGAIEGLCSVWTQPGRASHTGILSDVDPSGIFVERVATRGATVEVEKEGEEGTLPVKEPRTATTL
jgi:hypothetical protein